VSGNAFDSLSKAQLDALCSVAFGGHGDGKNPRTLAALERMGLISPYEDEIGVPDRFGAKIVQRWEMSLGTHVEFCAWCATQAEPVGEQGERS
jgi:hypothetical protein